MMPKLLRILLLFWSVSLSQLAAGQTTNKSAPKPCGTPDITPEYLAAHPTIKKRLAAIEAHTQRYIKQAGSVAQKPIGPPSPLIVIPVVVHVVYNTADQNLSDAVIQSQIDELNLAFRGQLSSGTGGAPMPAPFASLVGDARISFCLATRDPGGAPTNGITRNNTATTIFNYQSVKYSSNGGTDAWDTSKYLNIWCCNLTANVYGWAVLPGEVALASPLDGVVVSYTAFGRGHAALNPNYTLGRTAVHEVGHWLGLYHIWGIDGGGCSGTDDVSDTPIQAIANYGNPTFPRVSCTVSAPNGDMFVNHMDYTNDESKLMFSARQALRMQATIGSGGWRQGLKNSPGLCPTLSITSTGTIPTMVASGDQTPFRLRAGSGSVGCGGGVIQYQWTATNSWTIDNTAAYAPLITPNGTSGSTISLTGTYINLNGVSFPLNTVSITVGFIPALPTPVFTYGPTMVCTGWNSNFSVASIAGATSYRWTLPPGFTPTGSFTTTGTNQYATTGPLLYFTVGTAVAGDIYAVSCQALGSGYVPSATASYSFSANGGPLLKIVDADPSQNYPSGTVCAKNRISLVLVPMKPAPPGTSSTSYSSINWSSGAQTTYPSPTVPLQATYYTVASGGHSFTVTATYIDACGVRQSAVPYSATTAPAGGAPLGNGYSCTPNQWRPASAPYPNPTTSQLQLPGYQGPVVVYNQQGKQVHRLLTPGTEYGTAVDTSTWPEGLYVVTGRNLLGEFQRHNVQVQH